MCEMLAFRRAIKVGEGPWVPPHLSDEWAKMEKWPHILIALPLLRPETIYHVYWGFLACHISGLEEDSEHDMVKHSEITTERVDAFLRDTPSAEVLVARKVEAQRIFDDEFERYREKTPDLAEGASAWGVSRMLAPSRYRGLLDGCRDSGEH